MPLVLTEAGIVDWLRGAVRDTSRTDAYYSVWLFQSDTTPTRASVIGDFTEANYADYLRQTLLRSLWSTPLVVGERASSSYSGGPLVWTPGSGAQTIYGYLLMRFVDLVLLGAERFAAAHEVTPTEPLSFTPVVTMRSQFP